MQSTSRNRLILLSCFFLLLYPRQLHARQNGDSTACLIRYEKGIPTPYKIPMTSFYFVKDAGLSKGRFNGWIMQWDVIEKPHSNLLFMEMNSTDVKGWYVNESVAGSVQLVFEVPVFKDSFVLKDLTSNTSGFYIVNNYGGASAKKAYVQGTLKITTGTNSTLVNAAIELVTQKPDTRQAFALTDKAVTTVDVASYRQAKDAKDSLQEAEKDELVNAMVSTIITRDSIGNIEKARIRDSLKLNPYKGKFRFWASNVNKVGYSRTTYFIHDDSLTIKEGPYDFLILAKNYPKDSVYYKKALSHRERNVLAALERTIESDTLKEWYSNHCIMDGLVLSFSFESTTFQKEVAVSNYYQEKIALIVQFLNSISPKKYRIWYDKKELLKYQAACGK